MLRRAARLWPLAAALAAAPPLWASATGERQPLEPEDVVGLASVTSAAPSPSGSHVVFRRSRPSPTAGTLGELVVCDAQGAACRPYSTELVSARKATWTPAGDALLFLARGAGANKATALHRVPLDGGAPREVLRHEGGGGVRSYALAPDGETVAFTTLDPEPKARAKARKAGHSHSVADALERPLRIRVGRLGSDADADAADELPLAGCGSVGAMAFSPDGSRLAVVAAPSRSADDRIMRRRIVVLPVGGDGEAVEIPAVDAAGCKMEPDVQWSPDGSRLLFVGGVDRHDPAASAAFVAPASGAGPPARVDFPGAADCHVEQALWLDDATALLLVAEGCHTRVAAVDVASGAARDVVPARVAAWSSMALSADGHGRRLSLVGSTAAHPNEAFVAPVDGSAPPLRLSDSNDDRLAAAALGRQTVMAFRARDGEELEAVVILPPDYDASRGPYPLVLGVHGGPEAHCRDGWLTTYSRPGQLLAGRGFVVAYPNYRGSTGRGVRFSQLSQGRLGREDMDDLVDCVGALAEAGLADPARVGLVGVSYGGYAAAVAATRLSPHFKAAVMMCGVSDQLSKLWTTDIPEEMVLSHWRTTPAEGAEPFVLGSPVYSLLSPSAPPPTTALLVCHGASDPRVPPSQADEIYGAMRALPSPPPVRLVKYGGEGHGNRRYQNRLDFARRQLRWLEWFVLGAPAEGEGGGLEGMPPPELDDCDSS